MNSPVTLGVSPTATSTPKEFSISGLRLYFPGVAQFISLPLCSSQFICAGMWDHRVGQPPFCLSAQLRVSAPPTCLDECVFSNLLVVRLLYSSIFCQFWLFFVFKLLLSFFWLCEEAQCVYLCLYLGRKSSIQYF